MHSELVTDVALQESFPLLGKHNQALVGLSMGTANLVCNQFVPAVLSCHLLPSRRLAFQAISGSR